MIAEGLKTDAQNEDLKALLIDVKEQYDADHLVNVDPAERARFDRLFDWMKHDGSEFDKLKMRYYGPDYRGVHAARDIKKGETILYVPKKEIISLEMAMESPIGALMAAKNLRNRLLSPKHSFLSCFIMQEKRKPVSYFKEFIDILPKAFTNFPIFYTVEERQWLEGSAMQNVITDKIKDIATDYNTICLEVPEFKQFSLKEYSEMRMMVCSRIFGISINGVKTDGFVAYADMLNHQRPKETQWSYCDDRQGFIIEATDDIKRGQPVYDSYGKKCNTRFLLNYGFINLNNDANEFPLVVRLKPSHPFSDAKCKMLKEDCRTFRVQADFQESVMPKFMSFMRFVEFDGNLNVFHLMADQWVKKGIDAEDDDMTGEMAFLAEKVLGQSVANERKVFESIKQLCEAALQKYPTTLEQDIEALKDESLTFNHSNCILFRSGEKEILHFLIDFSDYVLKLLNMSFKDAKKTTQSLPEKFASTREYLAL